jgi:hypothetical protein
LCGVVWCGVVWCGVVWCGVVWCGVVWCGVVWCGVVWYNIIDIRALGESLSNPTTLWCKIASVICTIQCKSQSRVS